VSFASTRKAVDLFDQSGLFRVRLDRATVVHAVGKGSCPSNLTGAELFE
jgi:hypothetical protein